MNRSDRSDQVLLASEIKSWPVLKMTPSLQISHDPTFGSGSFSEDLPLKMPQNMWENIGFLLSQDSSRLRVLQGI